MNTEQETELRDHVGTFDDDPASAHDIEIQQQRNVTSHRKPKQTIAYLDGLRGLAAFWVYSFHWQSWVNGPESPVQLGFGHEGKWPIVALPVIRLFFSGGGAAVHIFFVLSGYVLSRGPLRKLKDTTAPRITLFQSLLSALIRRPFRLFLPPAGVSLIFALSMHLPLGLAPSLIWPSPQNNLFLELGNWLLELCWALNPLQKHSPKTRWFPYDPPVWTLPVELNGSILIFAAVASFTFVGQTFQKWCAAILATVFLSIYEWELACFMGGLFLASIDLDRTEALSKPQASSFLMTKLSTRHVLIIHHAILLIAGWLLSQTVSYKSGETTLYDPGWYLLTRLTPHNYKQAEYFRFWLSIGAVLLVFAVLRIAWLQHILQTRPLRFLGKVSFPLYLVHIPILWTVGDRIYRTIGSIRQTELTTYADNLAPIPDLGPLGLSTRTIVGQCFVLPLNLLIAHLVSIWIDEPSVNLSQWVSSHIPLLKQQDTSSSFQ